MGAHLKPIFKVKAGYAGTHESYQKEVWETAKAVKTSIGTNEPDGDFCRIFQGTSAAALAVDDIMQAVRYLQRMP